MPIELPSPVSDRDLPSPPNVFIWLALLVVFLAAGAAWTLFSWPRDIPSGGSPWFWMQLLGYPFLAWCFVFGFRLHRYDEARNYWAARERVRQQDHEDAVAFGSEPLAVLGVAYSCAMASDGVAGRIAQEESALQACAPAAGMPVTRHTRLDLPEDEGSTDRLQTAFQVLLEKLDAAVRALPARVPFDVRLHLPDDVDPLRVLGVWARCWDGRGLRSAEAAIVTGAEGLMTLESWLDIPGGPALEKVSLFIAVQLHDTPPENSAEAAVALLLGWAPVAHRHDLTPLAMLHRPVACEAEGVSGAIADASLYACGKPADLHQLWHSGLNKADKVALLKGGSGVELGAAQKDGLPGVHDIDAALGYPGVAASWFAVALAIEHAGQNSDPQLIACREGAMRLAVVRPVAHQGETETS